MPAPDCASAPVPAPAASAPTGHDDGRTRGACATALSLALLALIVGCGGTSGPGRRARQAPAGFIPLPASYIPLPVGPGPRYRPAVRSPPGGGEIAGLRCAAELGPRFGAHVELFADRHVVLIPPGIGVVAPVRRGPGVRRGRCYYPLVTLGPTGVVEVAHPARRLTLGDFFAIWGQPLSATGVAGFAGHAVRAFVDGRVVRGDPADITLDRHAEIVLETSGYVVPHRSYGFVDGL